MCTEAATSADQRASAPREATGEAVDPITLTEVDSIVITTLMDNSYDGLLTSTPTIRRPGLGISHLDAAQFEGGSTTAGLLAEHGFSAHISIESEGGSSSVLFDTGVSPDGMSTNAERLGIETGDVQGVVLSHGHFDHVGGLIGMSRKRGDSRMPLIVHPALWTRRRISLPNHTLDLPTLSASALRNEGFEILERRHPSLLMNENLLITGEIDRTTEFERGMPPSHQALRPNGWEHDAAIVDDQAAVLNLRGKGLVIVTGCGHAGIVNIARHAMRLTGISKVAAIIGGFHLNGPAFEPVVQPTIDALTEMSPGLLVPGHCTGWFAQQSLANALPEAWTQSSSGSAYHLSGAL